MNAKGISIACCAVAAIAFGACSGDSQPTGPVTDGTTLYSQTLYSDANGSTPSGSSGSTSSSDSPSGGGTQSPFGSAVDGSDAPPSNGGSGSAPGSVSSFPIDRFIASQGTFCASDGMGGCLSYMSPTANYLGWFDNGNSLAAAVDYAGLGNAWMAERGRSVGTSISGTVTEETLADGRARVTVDLNGANVMAFITKSPDLNSAVAWGYRPAGSFDQTQPSLGHVTMRIVLINTAPGAPLPDLMQLVRAPQGGQILESVFMQYDGDGTLQSTGDRRHARVIYDGSRGVILASHPASAKTTAMGSSVIMIDESPVVVAPA